jgi:hypothetical protein
VSGDDALLSHGGGGRREIEWKKVARDDWLTDERSKTGHRAMGFFLATCAILQRAVPATF